VLHGLVIGNERGIPDAVSACKVWGVEHKVSHAELPDHTTLA